MTGKYIILTEEIFHELEALTEVIAHIETGVVDFQKVAEENKVYIIEAVALSLQSFYTGIENIFRRIATYIDGALPTGEKWHTNLLERMSILLPEIRPAVISNDTKQELKEFLSFRHAIRSVYIFEINGNRVIELASTAAMFFQKLKTDLDRFTTFLKQVGNGN